MTMMISSKIIIKAGLLKHSIEKVKSGVRDNDDNMMRSKIINKAGC